MKTTYLEHVNIAVKNLNESISFIQLALPDFKIRGKGFSDDGHPWVHIGTDDSYLALNEVGTQFINGKDYTKPGLNHLGFVVSDVDIIAEKLFAAGYERSYPKQTENYRIRDYFLDNAGNEYEFVQYLSDKPAERNQY